MDMFEKIEKTRHFGELFMTWLWYRSVTHDTIFELSGGTAVALAFDSQMTLEAKLSEAERTTLSGGAPADSREAYEGLRQGKIVSQAKLRVQFEEKEWIFVLSGASMTISGLKIPALMTKADDDKLYERQALVEQIDGLVRGLYEMFLSIRLDRKAWAAEKADIREWMRTHGLPEDREG